MRSTWRSIGAIRSRSSTILTKDRSTRRSPLESAAEKPAFCRRWDQPAIVTITRCARASTQRSNASCLPNTTSQRNARLRLPFSISSQAGTTRISGIQPSASSHHRGYLTSKKPGQEWNCAPYHGVLSYHESAQAHKNLLTSGGYKFKCP
jgi:hypothetical protein